MKRKQQKEQTKKEILKTAIKLFSKNGFMHTSTAKIAEVSNIAHGTIFVHFPKRSDLIIETIYSEMQDLGDNLNAKSRNSTDIKELCEIFIDEIHKHNRFYTQLVKELPLFPLELQRAVFASLSGFSVHFVEVIERMQQQSHLKNFKPSVAVMFWFAIVNYIYSYQQLLGTNKRYPEMKNDLLDFFMSALTAAS
jgi:AcrR family transcriptional regulator